MTSKERLRCLISRAKIESGWQKERIITYKEEDKINKEIDELANPIFKDLEVLEILKPFLKRGLHVNKKDLTKEENKIYRGYLPKNYNKTYIYIWDYNCFVWDVFRNEENAIKLKEWLEDE